MTILAYVFGRAGWFGFIAAIVVLVLYLWFKNKPDND
jgi:hypothetical protein